MEHPASMMAILVPMAGGIVWIGTGVWRIAKWTERQDARVGHLEDWQVKTDTRLGVIEADVTQLKVDQARLEAAQKV